MARILISPRFFLIPVLGMLVAACSEETRSKVVVNLELGPGVLPPQTIRVNATQGSQEVKNAEIGWGDAGAGPDQIGIFFPGSVSGQVTIAAKAYRGDQMVAEGRIDAVTLKKGASVGPFSLVLNASAPTPGPDGGMNDGGNDGGALEVGPKDAKVADTTPPNPEPDGGSFDGGLADTSDDAPLAPGIDSPIVVADASVPGDAASPPDSSSPDAAKDVQVQTDAPTSADTAVLLGDTSPGIDATVPSDGFVSLDTSTAETQDAPADQADTTVNLPDAPIVFVDAADAASPPADTATDTDAAHSLAWEPATNIQNGNGSDFCRGSVVAVDPVYEHVTVAWIEDESVKVRRWNRQTATWEAIIILEDGSSPYSPAISADAQGNTMVLWAQDSNDTDTDGVWMSRAANGTNWSQPTRIAAGRSEFVSFALARNGKGHAVYTRRNGSVLNQYTAYYDGSTWTEASPPVEADLNDWNDPAYVALGASGDGLLIFPKDAWYLGATVLTGTTFSPPIFVDPNQANSRSTYAPALAVNRKGEGIVIWTESPNDNVLLARRYDPSAIESARWSTVTQVATSPSLNTPAVALDEQGTATVVWQQDIDPDGLLNLKAKRGPLGGPWGQVVDIETDNRAGWSQTASPTYADPRLAIDWNGNVLLAWNKDTSSGAGDITWGVYAARYSVATNTWSPQIKLVEKAGFGATSPSLSVADSGLGAATFYIFQESATTNDPDAYEAQVSIFR